jgi:hypothetical protein
MNPQRAPGGGDPQIVPAKAWISGLKTEAGDAEKKIVQDLAPWNVHSAAAPVLAATRHLHRSRAMLTRVKFSDLELAFEFASFEGVTAEHLSYVRKDTGEILYGRWADPAKHPGDQARRASRGRGPRDRSRAAGSGRTAGSRNPAFGTCR